MNCHEKQNPHLLGKSNSKRSKNTGTVKQKVYGPFSFSSDISSAITQYPKAFRAGSVGPDFFHEMIVEQTAIYPVDSGKTITSPCPLLALVIELHAHLWKFCLYACISSPACYKKQVVFY